MKFIYLTTDKGVQISVDIERILYIAQPEGENTEVWVRASNEDLCFRVKNNLEDINKAIIELYSPS